MAHHRLVWQILIPFLTISFLAALATGWLAYSFSEDTAVKQAEAQLGGSAAIAEMLLHDNIRQAKYSAISQDCLEFGRRTGLRLTVILPNGQVIGESSTTEKLENHGNRPEFQSAVHGVPDYQIRRSATLGDKLIYYAMPSFGVSDNVVAVVRTATSLTRLHSDILSSYISVAIGVLILWLITAFSIVLVAHRISRPIVKLRNGAERFGSGDFSQRVEVSGSAELAQVAMEMNHMAELLDERIKTVLGQRNELEVVLASLIEGIVAVDFDGHILRVNASAARLLMMDADRAQGKSVEEAIRDADVQRFIAHAINMQDVAEGEIVLRGPSDKYVEARSSLLRDASGKSTGIVLALHDITELRKLENIRKEFVANVSHELRTPITSIKGFVETLRDGAVSDPESAGRFLSIIAKHTDRLNAIIEDLLRLSKIERDSELAEISLEEEPVRPIVDAAVSLCAGKAAEKSITVVVECLAGTKAQVNSPLLEQAVMNLLDNAIKYSEAGGKVELSVACDGIHTVIAVKDYGCGIESEHLPRIFERFYRVDKARSRRLGGTGLGLAISKHIALAHGGSIGVASEPGKGSTFSISLSTARPKQDPKRGNPGR
ncbi:MAG: ATP-binding protein [Candidatus Brocadiia bacterium]